MSKQVLLHVPQRLTECSKNPNSSVQELRGLLSILVEEVLTNTDTVASFIMKTGESSQSFLTLDLLIWNAGEKPGLFVQQASSQRSSPAGAADLTADNKQSHGFTRWCISRILRLLGEENCSALHQKCCYTITQLLLVIKWKNLFMFRLLLTELVQFAKELCGVSDRLAEMDNGHTETLKSFRVPVELLQQGITDPAQGRVLDEVNLTDVSHILSDEVSCSVLQINVVKILEGFISDICQFAAHQVDCLWDVLCSYLENGTYQLKIVVLHAMIKLLVQHGFPPRCHFEYFIQCITALVQMLAQVDEPEFRNDLEQLEIETANILTQLISIDQDEMTVHHLPLQTLHFFYVEIAETLYQHGLKNLQTSHLRNSIGRFLGHMMKRVQLSSLIGWKDVAQKLIRGLLRDLGSCVDLQGIVGPLAQIIQSELRETSRTMKIEGDNPYHPITGEDTAGKRNDTPTAKSRTKKRKISNEDEKPSILKFSKLYGSLYKKFKWAVTPGSNEDISLEKLEAVRVVLEIIAHCVVCRQKDVNGGRNLWSFITETDFCCVLTMWKTFLQSQLTTDDTVILNKGLKVIADTMSALLTLNVYDDNTLRPEHFQTFGWILTMMWLPAESKWLDLNPEQAGQVAEMASKLSPHIDLPNMDVFLKCLSSFPKSALPKWRAHVLGLAMTDGRVAVKISALQYLPMFLYTLGSNTSYLLTDLLHPLLNESSTSLEVFNIIADKTGLIACVISKYASLGLSPQVDVYSPAISSLQITCSACSSETSFAITEKKHAPIDPQLMLPLLKLLKCGSPSAKSKFVDNLNHIFSHMVFKGNKNPSITFLTSCLDLMEDAEDYKIRLTFSKKIEYVFTGEDGGMATGVHDLVFNRVKEAYTRARSQNCCRLQETILMTSGNLGKVCEGDQLLVIIINLLESMLSQNPLVAATSFHLLKDLASNKNTTLKVLFLRYRQQICQFLAGVMHDAHETPGVKNAQEILQEITNVLELPDLKTFIEISKKYLLPYLVSKATQTASDIIKIMATACDLQNRKMMLMNNIHYIFSVLVRTCHSTELEKPFRFIYKETVFDLGNLLRMRFQQALNELLLYLSSHYQQVFYGLKILASHDSSGRTEINTSGEMADYLRPRLLGFLAFFDIQLENCHIPIEEKKLALESLVAMMRLMGPKHMTPVRLKVITTLRRSLAIQQDDFLELSCRAWNCFVRSVDFQSLGPMLSQIIATLLYLLEKLPRQVVEIINFLIVENRDALHENFHEIYFLPDIEELSDANSVLKQYIKVPSSEAGVKSQIELYRKGVCHENLDVRLYALAKLRLLLQQHQSTIHKLVLGNETAAPIISKLVSDLLNGCRDLDQRARLLFGECLGGLGAIDPGRLELTNNNPTEEHARFHDSVEDDNFAFNLINEVSRRFLAATDPNTQNRSAFALQKLLQIYNIGKEDDSSGQKLWKRFPLQTQEILLPLLSSKYALQNTRDWSKLERPIYGSKKGSKFTDWVTTWAGYLTSKVKEEKAYRVFQACEAQMKEDTHITLSLLPHIVLYVLKDGLEEEKKEITAEIMVVISQLKKPAPLQVGASDLRPMSAQTIFAVFDYLNKWLQRRAQALASKAGNTRGDPAYLSDAGYQAVNQFLQSIPLDQLSEASNNCNGYPRALMYFEQYITSKKQDLQEHLDFLQQLYASMDEPDGVQGVATVRQSQATVHQEIFLHQCTGQLTYALACYEKAIRVESNNINLHHGLLRNYMDLGQQSTALVQASGILSERPAWSDQLNSYRVEAAWKLGNWKRLQTFTKVEKQKAGWSVGLGRVLLAARNKHEAEFLQQLKVLRGDQLGPLSAASMESGSYQRGYEYIMRLHMLEELEQSMRSFVGFSGDNSESGSTLSIPSAELFKLWEARLNMTQFSFRTQEPILTLRKAMLLLGSDKDVSSSMESETGQIWLRMAKVARKAGHLQTAYSAMLQASTNCNPTLLCQEKAKLLWKKGDHDQSLACLESGIAENFTDIGTLKLDQSAEAKTKKLEYARTLFLFGKYSEETSSMESNAIMRQYKEVIEAYPEWEDGHFYLARYYDKIMTTLINEKDRPEKQGEFTIYVVRYFGQSLRYGNQYIYQSMPRLLSLWLDYGSMVVEAEKKEKGKPTQKLATQRTILDRLNKIVGDLRQQLAPYQLFTTLPQLISRICHTQSGVSAELQEIIAHLLVAYPQQAMWMMMAVSKSSYPMRVKRCQEIFAKAKHMKTDLHKFIQDATKLTERLLELCEKEVPKMTPTLSMTQHFRPLRRLLEDSQFSRILMPLQDAMTVMLPSDDTLDNHDPFPGQQVLIDGFEDIIEILPSLQKPKKITMKGSDGRLYVMMCKPKDDLRKDCRLMEFNGIVNKFLRRDPESRRRQLHIRTYTVVPLNEECGLIEWVNNTSGLRHILIKLYREKCLYMSGKELQSCMPALHSSLDTKLTIYRTKLLVRHPPVFNEWFRRTFPDPTSWYSARSSYSRTTAVMSMVGYILGLGDRHGENILFDSTNGDCVHVDFNCLFNKGETFEWPERVPFRLTPNMVEAMGPLGFEGLFRQASEVTLRVMRNQMDSLMSVLKPFVYDPLVEWSKPARGRSNVTETGEITNEQAMTHVQNIEHRLKGILKSKTKPRGLPLSIEGHVKYLIKEATDEKNLCQMYIGWAAYL